MPFSNLFHKTNLFLDDKPAVFALRQKAQKALLTIPSAFQNSESWKYLNISPILKSNFKNETDNNHVCEHNCCTTDDTSPYIEIKFCHGKLHIEDYNTPEGLIITPLPIALYEGEYKHYLFNSFKLEDYPFAALNGCYLEQGLCICVDKNTHIDKPILIKYNQTGCNNKQINLHNVIILEKNARLELLEMFSSTDEEAYLTNIVNEIYLKSDSELIHYKSQKENALSYHIALNAVKIQKNAFYKQFYFASGAKISRQENLINLNEEKAATEIYSAYKSKTNSQTNITTNINHHMPETKSNQYAKTVLEKDSSASFQGKIYIAPNAINTTGYQLHKGLYLNDNATLNCKPELEIYADNVKCSHGASCGELDKEQLFYLTSRGINKEAAIQILTEAHLAEIFSLIPNPIIKNTLISD